MKKFVKMSLVAALAVAGTTASAQPLAEAIKNVDVSGTVVYRYDDKATEAAGTDSANTSANYYKVGVSLSSKVNDDVKFNTRLLVADANGNFAAGGLDTSSADANPGVTLSQANFTYTGLANTSVTVGKQGLATPWTNAIDSDGSEQTGTGILAATTMGPVTAAAGYFNQTDSSVSSGAELMVAGLLGKVGPVNLQAWYLDIDETFDAYFVSANTSFDIDAVKIGLDAKYSDRDTDGVNGSDDINLLEVGATAKMGIFNAGVAYAETGKDGSGIVNAVSTVSQIGYSVAISGDAEMWMYDLGVQVTPELHIGLNYDTEDVNGGTAGDHDETYVQATYKMSKNLMTYIRLADGEQDGTTDYQRGRLQVQYSF